MSLPAFEPMPKMPRLTRDAIVTEKIDGTNASIYIPEEGESLVSDQGKVYPLLAASRTRWITPEQDNAGFARWVHDHTEELLTLGPGHHFGEWWGGKIQIGYGLAEKIFSLFNVMRWKDVAGTNHAWEPLLRERFKKEPALAPTCCRVVPIVAIGEFPGVVAESLETLRAGSLAAPGWTEPEGVVAFHVHGGFAMKKTFAGDEAGKSYGS